LNVYIDTGIFIDYLSVRGLVTSLRSNARRGRQPAQLASDAEMLLRRIAARHIGGTSTITFYEAEEVIFKDLVANVKGFPLGRAFVIPIARSVIPQLLTVMRLFGLRLVDLTAAIVQAQAQTIGLQTHGVRAADAIHIATAASFGADLIVTGDRSVITLDQVIPNCHGQLMRCVDSDAALGIV
jgi:predicted nucleic acid-binding protein